MKTGCSKSSVIPFPKANLTDYKTPGFLNYMGNKLYAQERFQEAIGFFNKAICINPDYPEAYYNMGNALDRQGQIEASIESFRCAVSIRPGFAEAHYNMGNCLYKLQKYEKAVECYHTAIAIKPKVQVFHLNLANALKELGKIDIALKHYNEALSLTPIFPEALYNLGNTLVTQGELEAGVENYRKAIKINSNFPEAYCSLAKALGELGSISEAIECFNIALKLRPDFEDAKRGLQKIYMHFVPRWHFAMMNDVQRNMAYEKAIQKVVDRNSLVLEIGTGSGLLAMMAARCGAKHVISCEIVAPIVKKAREIIKKNGLDGRITLLHKNSLNLKIGRDLNSRADVLIAEIFDAGLLGEGIVQVIKHARSNLLVQNPIIIPRRATIYGMLVESRKLYNQDRVKSVSGFDLSPFNDFSYPSYFQAQLFHSHFRKLSDVFEAFSFDFCGTFIHGDTKKICIQAIEDAKCHAIVFWFRLFIDDENYIDTGPRSGSHWQQAIQLIDPPINFEKGEEIVVIATHDCSRISFDIESR